MIRRIIAGVLVLVAGWLAWQGLQGVLVLTSRGSPLAQALDPIVAVRIGAASLALLGGLLAAANVKLGGVIALIGTLLFTFLAGAFIAAGTDSSLWMDEVIGAGVLIVLTGGLLFLKRS
ncbi:MAG: hypothetical protein MUE84_09155 [Hyphomonas sp.]|jgi:hypothetical protein|nr:hypothetical protein [Hyphomonas sp.]